LNPEGTSQRSLSVVFLSDWLGFPNGMAATNRVRLLARGMAQAGAHVHVLCMQTSELPATIENRATRGEWHGVTFEYTCGTTVRRSSFLMRRVIEVRGWLTGAFRLVQLRRAGRMDGVYLWFTCQRAELRRALFVGLLRLLGVPVVMELNERPWPLRADRRVAERLVSPLACMDGVVSISSYLTEWARTEAVRRRRPLEIVKVPILVDMAEQPHPRERARREPKEREPVLVFAGAPEYDETVDFIVRAMEHVWRRFPACRLVITGARPGDPAAGSLRRRLMADGAAGDDRVHLSGYLSRDELLDLYQEAWALLIPLFDDVRSTARFPTKIGEYLASARPIVSTSVGEIARWFTDGEDAFLSPAGDAEQYGLKICAVLADEGLGDRVGAAGREFALAHFDYALYGRPLVEAFERVRRDAQGVGRRRREARIGQAQGASHTRSGPMEGQERHGR
jgi:glycosyltransferase involved in cell wall biosynthesis